MAQQPYEDFYTTNDLRSLLAYRGRAGTTKTLKLTYRTISNYRKLGIVAFVKINPRLYLYPKEAIRRLFKLTPSESAADVVTLDAMREATRAAEKLRKLQDAGKSPRQILERIGRVKQLQDDLRAEQHHLAQHRDIL